MRRFDDGLEDLFPGINWEMRMHDMGGGERWSFNRRCLDLPIYVEDTSPPIHYGLRPVFRRDLVILCASYDETAIAPEVAEETGLTSETVKPKPEEKEKIEDVERRARKPPADGPCKGCGQNKPLNRLFLCYRCWTEKQLADRGWKAGQPHPSWCGCDLDCRFESKEAGN